MMMENFLELIEGRMHLKVIVKINKPKTQLAGLENDTFRMDVKAQPIEGKANIEIINFFKKKYKLDVKIVSGSTSRKKLLRIVR